MYYEEQWIDGKLCWRGAPDGEWIAYEVYELGHRYQAESKRAYDLQQTVERLERECVKWQEVASLRTAGDAKFLREMELLKKDKADLQAQLAAKHKQLQESDEAYYAVGELNDHLKQQVAQLREELEQWKSVASIGNVHALHTAHTTLRGLVDRCGTALTDWLRCYAPEEFTDEQLAETRNRLHGGTLAYIAELQRDIKATLPREGGAQEVENAL